MGGLACRVGEIKKLIENATYGLSALKDLLAAIEGSGFATGTDSLKVLSDALDLIMGSGFATGADSLKIISDMLDTIRTELTFQHQADATLSQAAPTQNEWYTVLDTTLNARIRSISVAVATTSETIQIKIEVDGVTITGSGALTAGTNYFAYFVESSALLTIAAGSELYRLSFMLEGRSVKVSVCKTTANGSGTITARVKYAKR